MMSALQDIQLCSIVLLVLISHETIRESYVCGTESVVQHAAYATEQIYPGETLDLPGAAAF
jgi:hypothetical protein